MQAGAQMTQVDGWDVPGVYSTIEAEYAAAHDGAVVYDSHPLGRLRLTGSTRIDFLHRMSTNDMNALSPGQGAATILTTPIGRIVDRIVVYAREDDALLLTSRGAQALVANWLKKYIFFNDDVQVHDASAAWGMLSLYGAKAGEAASAATGGGAAVLKLHAWRAAGDKLIVARTDSIAGAGFHVLASEPGALKTVWGAAMASGATPIGERACEILRIESGLPRYPHELSEAYIPLEVGLWPDVSFTKGCYIGQEIIARMESRQRLAKQMVGLRSASTIESGAELYAANSAIGKVSSVALRPGGESIALGFVKPSHAQDGQALLVGGERSITAEVTRLPIPRSSL
jgi:aminomethyltransferase